MKSLSNPFASAAVCCCDFLIRYLEEFLKYLVRNAFIIVALDGTPLMTSGKKAFILLAKNLIDVIALNNVGDFVLFLGRIFVVSIAGFVSYEMVNVSIKNFTTDSCSANFIIIYYFRVPTLICRLFRSSCLSYSHS